MSRAIAKAVLKAGWSVENVSLDFSRTLAMGYVSKGPERKVRITLRDPHTTRMHLDGYDHEVAATLLDLGIVQSKKDAEDVFTQRVPLPHWEGTR